MRTVSNPSSTPTDTKKATKEQRSECWDVADFGYGRTAHVPAATVARSHLSSFVAIRKRPDDRFPSANGDLQISLDLDLRIWKACASDINRDSKADSTCPRLRGSTQTGAARYGRLRTGAAAPPGPTDL